MGFVSSTTRPIEEEERRGKTNAGAGVAIKAFHDARPAEEGVTRLSSSETKKDKSWKKKAQRYQYRAGFVLNGKNVGGQFTTAPDNAPSRRKRKKR